jgi:hypothetical protein
VLLESESSGTNSNEVLDPEEGTPEKAKLIIK